MRLLHLSPDAPNGEPASCSGAEVPDALEAWLAQRQGTIWIDLEGEEDAEAFRALVPQLGLDPGAVAEALLTRYPPKVEFFAEHAFLLFRGVDAQSDSIDFGTIQIGVFLADDFLVTRHDARSPSTDATWAEVLRHPDMLGRLPLVVAKLGVRVCARYLPILLNLESRLEEMENELFANPTDQLIEELLVYKRQLKKLRRIASYHVNLFERLAREDDPWFDPSLEHDLLDGVERFERIVSLANLYNDQANDLMNAYLSISSHRLNNIMKVLTIVTAIFVPLSFLAGIYGMNFEYMPELAWDGAYFVLLGVMATVVTVLLLLFRRRGWI